MGTKPMPFGAPAAPSGWDTKTQTQPTQTHHDGAVHNEHKSHPGTLPPNVTYPSAERVDKA